LAGNRGHRSSCFCICQVGTSVVNNMAKSCVSSVARSNSSAQSRQPAAAPAFQRVCRAWHESSRVKVPTPGVCRAEG
jgi:hypothetical protein